MKHSKGLWFKDGSNIRDIDTGGLVAEMFSTDARRESDARLIAAAPELLTALEALINFVDPLLATGQLPDDLKQFEKALYVAFRASSKARGES